MKDENPFNSKLYHHTLPVRNELWESIEKRLPPETEQKRFPFFWFLLFASTIISGALMFGILHKKTTPAINSKQIPSYTSPDLSGSIENTTNAELHNNSTLAEESNTTTAQNPTTHQQELNSSSVNSASSAMSTGLNTSSNTNSTRTGNSSTKHHSSSSTNSTLSTNSTSSSFSAAASTASSTSSATSKHKKTTSASSTAISKSAVSATESKISEAAIVSNSNAVNANSTDLLPLADVESLGNPKADVIGLHKFKPDPDCYRFSGVTGKYLISVDGFAGPGFSPRSFTIADAESSSYSVARETTENHQYAWSAGTRINVQVRNGLAFRLGLMYDQAGDVFDYTDTLATHSTFRIDSFFSADGTFLYSDSSRVLIFGTLIKKIHNTYRHLDVPILLSYEMQLGRTSSLMFNFGPVFNLVASYEGQILDPMLHPRTITPGSQNELYAYKTSLGLSLYFGAGLVVPLTDKISGLVEPRYLYRIKPVTIKSYPLEEHRHFAGLNLGIRYYLD